MVEILNLLIDRLNQMHAALGAISDYDLTSLRPVITVTPHSVSTEYQLGSDRVALMNQASLVIDSIGKLKDHFKEWLKQNGRSSQISEDVINDNPAVAIIHDLWNKEKHVHLTKPSRSGHDPELVIRDRGLVVGRGTEVLSQLSFVLDTETGALMLDKQGDVCIRLNAEIRDQHGTLLGDFEDVCTQAAQCWLSAMKSEGVTI
jgi:hypothetical protein